MKLKIQSIKDYFKSKKDRGLEPVFFEKIADKNTSRDQIKKIWLNFLSLKVLSTLAKNIETKDNNIVWAFKYARIYSDLCPIKLNLNANYYLKQSKVLD